MSQPESTNGHVIFSGAPSTAAPERPRSASRWQKILAGIVILYGLSIVALWAWMVWQGDRERLATVVLFGPRWLCGIPLPFLAIAAAIWYRRLLVVLAVTAVVLVGPFMGFKAHLSASRSALVGLRVLTCNVDQDVFDARAFAELIVAEDADVVAVQELSSATQYHWPPGWQVLKRDEFLLASRWPIRERNYFPYPFSRYQMAAICYEVQLPDREVQVFNVHLRSPRSGFEAVMRRGPEAGGKKLDSILEIRDIESESVAGWIAGFDGPKIVVGDFNMPADSTIFRRDWTWLADAFGTRGWGFGFTKISNLGRLRYGARIDHVLYGDDWSCMRSWVGPGVGSDHLPLFAEFE